MTDPSPSRPVPGPPRPGPGSAPAAHDDPPAEELSGSGSDGDPFEDLDNRPVAEHVAAFEAEHARLERELGTIDRL